MAERFRKGVASGSILIALLVLTGAVTFAVQYSAYNFYQQISQRQGRLETFQTCSQITDAFNESRSYGWFRGGILESMDSSGVPTAAPAAAGSGESQKASDYSSTNIQVEGVDEADIVKSDGEYLYIVSGKELVIVKAYPAGDAEVVSETGLDDFRPEEMFIHGDRVMLFGYIQVEADPPEYLARQYQKMGEMIYPYPYYKTMTSVQIWDVSDRDDPEMERQVDFEGSYVTARKIGNHAYFVVNSYPDYYAIQEGVSGEEILPAVRDSRDGGELEPACGCDEVARLLPSPAQSFITLVSISMDDPDADVETEVIVGSGQTVYASLENIYIAEYQYQWGWGIPMPMMDVAADIAPQEPKEATIVHKFSMDEGNLDYEGNAEVPGRVLNQFSMDEHDGFFRIAMTEGRTTRDGSSQTSNNIYIYDDDMDLVGSLEDLAPGESIYSARFIGDRAYLVTFLKVDPLFVIDLSDPSSPSVLGKLKIPGYSDYLHPYDEDHIIGIGKDSEPAEEEQGDFAWYQGVKIALFDVSDVENPVELHKVVIGDRGTSSEALHDHKAFLFDREKELLVIPILLAEFQSDPKDLPSWSRGDYVYQGAYVYSLNLDDGFDLKGRITHYDDEEVFEKSGYYYFGDSYTVKRSGYLDDVLYTLSTNRLKLSDLGTLDELATLDFGEPEEYPKYYDDGVAIGITTVDAPVPETGADGS